MRVFFKSFFFCCTDTHTQTKHQLTTPEQGWSPCWFRRPRAAPPRKGWPWPAPARRSHWGHPRDSPCPSAAFAGTWQRTAFPSTSPHTFLPLQIYPWARQTGRKEEKMRGNNPNHITCFEHRLYITEFIMYIYNSLFGKRLFCLVSKQPAGPLDYI